MSAKDSNESSLVSLGDLAKDFLKDGGGNLSVPDLFQTSSAKSSSNAQIPDLFAASKDNVNQNPIQVPQMFASSKSETTDSANLSIPDLFGPSVSRKHQPDSIQIPNLFNSKPDSSSSKSAIPARVVVPDLFGNSVPGDKIENELDDTKTEDVIIDLMLALNAKTDKSLKLDNFELVSKTHTKGKKLYQNSPDSLIDFFNSNFVPIKLKRTQGETISAFGSILCQEEILITNPEIENFLKKRHPKEEKIKPFTFDKPSPDDIVKAAQYQVFRR